jgi:hypothetical protein
MIRQILIYQFLGIGASLFFASAQQQPALLNDPPDGSAAPMPVVRAVFKPAEVLETTVTRQGGRDIIVQRLALDPNDPIKPVVPAPPVSPSPQAAFTHDYDVPPSYILLLSATVHPGPRTRLGWTHHSQDGSVREFYGWSNIDFNHFTGISTFLGTDGQHHTYIMGISTEQVALEDAPEFASEDPTFIPDGEVPAEALIAIASMHGIYAKDGEKLAAAHAGRERDRLAKEAELLANPPQPKDLIIRYRIAVTPLPTPAAGGAQ